MALPHLAAATMQLHNIYRPRGHRENAGEEWSLRGAHAVQPLTEHPPLSDTWRLCLLYSHEASSQKPKASVSRQSWSIRYQSHALPP